MATVKLTSKGQVTIPASVRAALGLVVGSRIEFVEMGDGKFAIFARNSPVTALKGVLRKPASTTSIDDMNLVIAAQAADAVR